MTATARPLYSLFTEVDVHLTAFSTCTLEALAFGVPTLLCSENGHRAFRELVGPFGTLLYAGHDWVDEPLARRSMELMAEEVMPRVNKALGSAEAAD